MDDHIDISATIVLFNEDIKLVRKSINSFLSIPLKKKLFLIDNSPSNILETEFIDPEILYIFLNKNVGFGKGHNTVLDKIAGKSHFHLILNPDVEFDIDVIPNMIKEMARHEDVAMIAPRVVFPDGEHQHSCRRYPTILDLLARRLKFPQKTINVGEYRDLDLTKPFYPDFIQGCFQLFRTLDFIKIGGFDERYFLYMEDVDICRKIDEMGKKKLYYPNVQISHTLKRESSKKIGLFFTHINSSIKYFKKWGF